MQDISEQYADSLFIYLFIYTVFLVYLTILSVTQIMWPIASKDLQWKLNGNVQGSGRGLI
jgi:hypothetical protein